MRSKCGRLTRFLPHFDVLCDLLLNRPTATWNLVILFYTMIRKEKRLIHIPALYRLTVQGFVPDQAFFATSATYRLCFLFFSLSYLCTVSLKCVSTYSEQSNGENILQNSESLVAMTHDGNCCEDFLYFYRHSRVVKSSFCLHFSICLLCK